MADLIPKNKYLTSNIKRKHTEHFINSPENIFPIITPDNNGVSINFIIAPNGSATLLQVIATATNMVENKSEYSVIFIVISQVLLFTFIAIFYAIVTLLFGHSCAVSLIAIYSVMTLTRY
jgi:hypothetical protein